MQRRMHLSELISARRAANERICWSAIFLKAYSQVAAVRPELRRCYLPWPWPRLFEHRFNVATFGIERMHEEEPSVFFARIARPELRSLKDLNELIHYYKSVPVEKVDAFRNALTISKFPLPIRRFLWWLGLQTDGKWRGAMFGTFGMSVVASLGAAGLHILSPLSTTLNYGAFEPDGSIDVRLVYDHRVMDGATVARAMSALEDELRGAILKELRGLTKPSRESRPAPISTTVVTPMQVMVG